MNVGLAVWAVINALMSCAVFALSVRSWRLYKANQAAGRHNAALATRLVAAARLNEKNAADNVITARRLNQLARVAGSAHRSPN